MCVLSWEAERFGGRLTAGIALVIQEVEVRYSFATRCR